MEYNFHLSNPEASLMDSRSLGDRHVEHVRGLNDVRKIAKELTRIGYEVKGITMGFGSYANVSEKDASKFKCEPSSYKISGRGLSLSIENFSRSRKPGYVGSPVKSGIEGTIKLNSGDKDKLDRIDKIINEYFITKTGYQSNDYFSILEKIDSSPFKFGETVGVGVFQPYRFTPEQKDVLPACIVI
jgi:hypothetical protein